MNPMRLLAPVLLALLTPMSAHAADNVRIGVIYPLTGNAASAGASAKDAVELGAEIVNHGARLQMGFPYRTDRVRFCQRVHAISL